MNSNMSDDIQVKIKLYNIGLAMLASAANQCKVTKVPDYNLIDNLPKLISALNDVATRACEVETLKGISKNIETTDEEPYAVILGDPSDYLFSKSGKVLMESRCGKYEWDPVDGKLESTITASIGSRIVLTGCKDPQGIKANLWTLITPTNVVRYHTLKDVVDNLYQLGFLGDWHTSLGIDGKVFEVVVLNPNL